MIPDEAKGMGSDTRRLLIAAVAFLAAVAGYAALVVTLGDAWTVLMCWLLLPYAAIVATFIHKAILMKESP